MMYVLSTPLLRGASRNVTQKPDIPGYSGFYPRINGYIVNCIRKNTKVAENFVLRCLAASDPGMAWNVVVN